MMRLRSHKPGPGPSIAVLAMAAILVAPGLLAQAPPQGQAPPPLPAVQVGTAPVTSAPSSRITLEAGKSTRVSTDFDITQIVYDSDEIILPVPIGPREFVLHGRAPGTISLILFSAGGTRFEHYEIVVEAGVSQLEQAIRLLFPGEDIKVTVNEGALVLSGSVSNNATYLRVGEIAQASVPTAQVINMLQLPGGAGSQQVMLQVRFAEVNRRAVEELGLSLFTTRAGFTARSTTQQFSAPTFDDVNGQTGGLVFADYLNLFFFQRNEGIGGVLKALEQNGWFESLAEPNLIAYNGQEASFLAGGEFPVPFASGANGAISVDFKEFGVRLTFTPYIAGDVIRLKVEPEVSSLDFNNGITISGFRIPALTTRRANTTVELRDGQSFAIAGLLNTINQEDRAAIPYLSRIPIIGNIFKSRSRREDQTELMVLITPRLTRPLNPDEVPPLPTIIRAPGGPGGGGGSGGGDLGSQLIGGGGLLDAPPVRGPKGGRF